MNFGVRFTDVWANKGGQLADGDLAVHAPPGVIRRPSNPPPPAGEDKVGGYSRSATASPYRVIAIK